jgi:hypothetical protein
VDNVTGTASGSQIAGMEGLNTILIRNSQLSSTLTGATASDPIADGVILYQSTSGDAESATGEAATFQAVDSTLTSAIQSGAMFYVTNTTANVVLSGTTLDFDSRQGEPAHRGGQRRQQLGHRRQQRRHRDLHGAGRNAQRATSTWTPSAASTSTCWRTPSTRAR